MSVGPTGRRGRLVGALLALLGLGLVAWVLVGTPGGRGGEHPGRAASHPTASSAGAERGAARAAVRVQVLHPHAGAVPGRPAVAVALPGGPPAPSHRPVLVLLHGRGGDGRSLLSPALRGALRTLGPRAPVVVAPDGRIGWWHRRPEGDWAGWVGRALAVARRDLGLRSGPTAVGGVSMGGFGATVQARRRPGRWCAVGLHAPALWTPGQRPYPDAFDTPAQRRALDPTRAVRAGRSGLERTPVWIDRGSRDTFAPGSDALAAALARAGAALTVRGWSGGHDGAVLDGHWPARLRFYAEALARCPRGRTG